MSGAEDWHSYWETLGSEQQVFAVEGAEYARRIAPLLLVRRPQRVLDFGCGFGHTAAELAPMVGEIWAWDAAVNMRNHASRRLAGIANARMIEPDQLESGTLPPFDLILVHSVIQYLTAEELAACQRLWAGLLAPAGHVVLSDLLVPARPAWPEFFELLLFARRHGFLGNAIVGGLKEIARYSRMRKTRPLHQHDGATLERGAHAAGLNLRVLPVNLTHRSGRRMALLRRAGNNGAAP